MTAAGDFDQRQGIPGVEQYAAWILVALDEAAYEEKACLLYTSDAADE